MKKQIEEMKNLTMIMEITTKGMAATKLFFNKFNHPSFVSLITESGSSSIFVRSIHVKKMNVNFKSLHSNNPKCACLDTEIYYMW